MCLIALFSACFDFYLSSVIEQLRTKNIFKLFKNVSALRGQTALLRMKNGI